LKLWRRDFIARLLGASSALAAARSAWWRSAAAAPALGPTDQVEYTMEVLSLFHAAREIGAGRGEALAASIVGSAPDHAISLLGFDESNYTVAAFYLAGEVLQSSSAAVPANLAAALRAGREKAKQVLSADCFDLTVCKEKGCVKWPTSLQPANVNAPNPEGWHYIVGSHCGFHWPKFWKLDCGPPVALKPCTDEENSSTTLVLTLNETSAVAPPASKPNADDQTQHALRVISLLHIAREVKAGRAEQVAASIRASAADYLTPMLAFDHTNLWIGAFYLGDVLYRSSGEPPPSHLAAALKGGREKIKEVLSDGCFDLTVCKENGCVKWPTSLQPVNVNAPNPMGWHYIVGSHCGFSWPKFWKLDCGQPVALKPCMGDETTTSTVISPEEQTFVPRTCDPNGYIVGTVVDPNTTGPTGFVYATVDEHGKSTNHTGTTDATKRFEILVPAGIALISVARRLDANGELSRPSDCKVGRDLRIPGLRELPNPPSGTPAIVAGNSSWERSKPCEFQTRGIDPRNVKLLIDGNSEDQHVLAASNSSVIARAATSPGTHTATLVSAGKPTNGVPSDYVDVAVTLTGSSEVGAEKVVALVVTGLPPDHPATCTFTITGSSEFVGGTSELTVPVVDGKASASVRNVRPGATALRWRLTVKIPGVWD